MSGIYSNFLPYARRIFNGIEDAHQHNVIALRIRGGNVISHGCSDIAYRRGASYFSCSLHAEADLVRKCRFNLEGDKICVYRFNRGENEDLDSRPCFLCAKMLMQANAGKIYFKKDGKIQSGKSTDLPMLVHDPVLFTSRFVKTLNSLQRHLYAHPE